MDKKMSDDLHEGERLAGFRDIDLYEDYLINLWNKIRIA